MENGDVKIEGDFKPFGHGDSEFLNVIYDDSVSIIHHRIRFAELGQGASNSLLSNYPCLGVKGGRDCEFIFTNADYKEAVKAQ